jgi:chromosome segregation ATPase
MATWDDSESESSESDSEEQANVAFMATTYGNSSDGESDPQEVFSDLSRSDLESCLSGTLSSYKKLKQKIKAIKEVLEGTIEECDKLEMTISELKNENLTLTKERDSTNKQCLKLEEDLSQAPQTFNTII